MTTTIKMPALFIGHGSPMNAIANNTFTHTLSAWGQGLPRPRAILVISAHWLTAGTYVTSTNSPRMIYDMYGFPSELYQVQYPAPGSEDIAKLVQTISTKPVIHSDQGKWGLDHGTWSVLKFLFPEANIPVLQLSIDMSEPPEYHLQMGRKLQTLREQGVMIVGSGNVTHNLRHISWEESATPVNWAVDFDSWFKEKLIAKNFSALTTEFHNSPEGKIAVPTLDHYLPILYTLGASNENEILQFKFEEIQNGSISMRAFQFG